METDLGSPSKASGKTVPLWGKTVPQKVLFYYGQSNGAPRAPFWGHLFFLSVVVAGGFLMILFMHVIGFHGSFAVKGFCLFQEVER